MIITFTKGHDMGQWPANNDPRHFDDWLGFDPTEPEFQQAMEEARRKHRQTAG